MKRIANCAFLRFALLCLSVLCLGSKLNAQTEEPTFFDAEKQMVLETKTSVLLENALRDSALYQAGRNAAIQIALKNGLPMDARKRDGSISLQGFDGTGLLGYYASDNAISAAILKTTQLYPDEVAELTLTGAGKTIGLWEVGRARLTHQEFGGRITQADNSSVSPDNHSNHVSGTMIAAGVDPDARGMAYEANLRAYDSNNDVSEMGTAAASPTFIRVSNHSYGWICGWDYDLYQGQPTWYWWGNPAISQTADYKFGQYDSRARDYDNVVYNAPFYLPVIAAGNDRSNTGPAPGGQHVVRNTANQWVTSNTARQPDGGSAGYDCIPPTQCAKNVLSVGAIEAEIDDELIITNMSSFSSWGPTDDGRIKPDIVSRGVNVYSCKGNTNSDYYINQGTSMAAPSVTGSLQLLLDHYANLNPGFTIRASALKGLVIHTASDSEGPNYEEGWGLMNTRAAADLMSHSFNSNSKDRLISRDSVTNGSQREYSIYYDGSGPLQATIVWTDPAGAVSSNTVNPSQLRLVNDLDIRLIREDDNTNYFPWILNPGNPSAPATKGDNFRDNVEQIFEENLPQGRYKLRVNHKGTLNGATQYYSLILSGRSNLLTACSGTITSGGSGNYLSNLHYSWTISPPNAATVTLNFTNFQTETNFDFVRVYDGTSASDPLLGVFTGSSLPPSLTASSGKMFIVFDTDISVTYPVWSASYSCGSAQLAVSTNSLSSGSGANSNTFNITSNCNWTISGVPAWLSVSPLSGNSNAQIQVNYSANNATSTRTATLQITGCNGITLTIEVTQFGCSAPSAPTVAASGSTNLCSGQSVILTASNVCAGCPVSWSNGQSGVSITVSTAGNYSATVGSNCGQSAASNMITVTTGNLPAAPQVTASGSTSLCPGESVTLTAFNICAGCSVNWSNGQSGASITVTTAGNYSATVGNTCGQSPASNMISITTGALPAAPQITASGSTSLCPGESLTLTASNVCAGCPVNWSNGQSGSSITVSTAGNYSATVGNTCGQSPASNTIVVTAGTSPTAPLVTASGSSNLCPGESVTLTASNVCAGCPVNWSNGQSGASITVSTAGNYSATVGNTCGVSPASNTITVTSETAPTIPILSASGSTSLCPGESVTLTASNICAGCTVNWSTGQTGASITVSSTGTYLANQSNTCGFGLSSNSIAITAAPPFLPIVQLNNLCHLAAPTGSNYQWYLNGAAIPGATGQFWSAQTSGYYVVSMTHPAGCAGISDPVFAEACVSNTVNLSGQLSLLLFPNPARDKVTLELHSAMDLSEARLELYGFDGRWVGTLFQSELLSGDSTLELSLPELPAGIYQYRLSSRQGNMQGSLVILP